MTKLAVIDDALWTVSAVTDTPLPLTETVVPPLTNPAPLNERETVVPALPLAGLISSKMGTVGLEFDGENELLSVQPVRSIAKPATTHASHALQRIGCTDLATTQPRFDGHIEATQHARVKSGGCENIVDVSSN
jgi:hypothetical protein